MNVDGDDDGNGVGAEKPVRQPDGVDPIGAALRATYDAENHDSLGRDLTGLMLALARIDDPAPSPVRSPVIEPAPVATAPRPWLQRWFGR